MTKVQTPKKPAYLDHPSQSARPLPNMYLVTISGSHELSTPKSPVQKPLFKLLQQWDRALIGSQVELEDFKKYMVNEIAQINADHPSMRPVGSTWLPVHPTDQYMDIRLDIAQGSTIQVKLLAINQ